MDGDHSPDVDAIRLSPADNVATVLRAVAAGERLRVRCGTEVIEVRRASPYLSATRSAWPRSGQPAPSSSTGHPIGEASAPFHWAPMFTSTTCAARGRSSASPAAHRPARRRLNIMWPHPVELPIGRPKDTRVVKRRHAPHGLRAMIARQKQSPTEPNRARRARTRSALESRSSLTAAAVRTAPAVIAHALRGPDLQPSFSQDHRRRVRGRRHAAIRERPLCALLRLAAGCAPGAASTAVGRPRRLAGALDHLSSRGRR